MSSRIHWPAALALLAAAALVACNAAGQRGSGEAADLEPPVAFDTGTVHIQTATDTFVVKVELAETDEQRSYGLMERRQLAENAGMLFVYGALQDAEYGFWMYRTLIPLDIAFADEDGRIVAIRQMVPCRSPNPQVCPIYAPGHPYLTALEVNADYFEKRGIGVGDRIVLLPRGAAN